MRYGLHYASRLSMADHVVLALLRGRSLGLRCPARCQQAAGRSAAWARERGAGMTGLRCDFFLCCSRFGLGGDLAFPSIINQ